MQIFILITRLHCVLQTWVRTVYGLTPEILALKLKSVKWWPQRVIMIFLCVLG
ncbi:hypothetical protein D3C80_1946590 [compost metagenome]